jgi:hypothetical protein
MRTQGGGALAMLRLMTAMAALLVSGASAPPPVSEPERPPRRDCFYSSQVTGFTNGGPDRVYANISRRATYELALSPGCSQIDWALDIAVRARGTQRICSGYDAELIVPRASGSGAQRCLIRTIRRLSDAERDAVRSSDAR